MASKPNPHAPASQELTSQALGRVVNPSPLTEEAAETIIAAQQILIAAQDTIRNNVNTVIEHCNYQLDSCKNYVRKQLDDIVHAAWNEYNGKGQIIRDNLAYLMSTAQQYAALLGYTGPTLTVPTWEPGYAAVQRISLYQSGQNRGTDQPIAAGQTTIQPRSSDPVLSQGFVANPKFPPQSLTLTDLPYAPTAPQLSPELVFSEGQTQGTPANLLLDPNAPNPYSPGTVIDRTTGLPQYNPVASQSPPEATVYPGIRDDALSRQQAGTAGNANTAIGQTQGGATSPSVSTPTSGNVAPPVSQLQNPLTVSPIQRPPLTGVSNTPQGNAAVAQPAQPQLVPLTPTSTVQPTLVPGAGVTLTGNVIYFGVVNASADVPVVGDIIDYGNGTYALVVPCGYHGSSQFHNAFSGLSWCGIDISSLPTESQAALPPKTEAKPVVQQCPASDTDRTNWTPWQIANCPIPAPPNIPVDTTPVAQQTQQTCCQSIDISALCGCINAAVDKQALVPVDLDQPHAFLYSPDDAEWKAKALAFEGEWLEALNSASTAVEFSRFALYGFPGADESVD